MSETKPAVSVRYFLNLEESQDGFALATFGKKQISRFITPFVSIGIIIWGFYLGFNGVGRYYVALGAFFLILQLIMRYWFLPMMFKRQFVKYQLGKSEQGIELFQDHAEIYANGRKQMFNYSDVQKFATGKLTYMIELKNRTVVVVPKRAFEHSADQTVFENTFKK
ncbi:YcxB family protein [Acinetobacter sp. C_4_1]|uniref:YcxB family protein n=1 Tax=unclassified Acinetobacter TaxID=196816 RepID=UPI0021B7B897|nr:MULTISPECIES: YcxB family protein [unclassified Acinetobacter]MCT8089981.1 YcxB family protein [Acinetobacter sp. F_3_1]MCT8098371.1 YcxB family protein [Acinetobacter sp. C_3_1]MCT8101439.1 YcxB family protein [Acinetobacter sp. C_4_1]MCT8135422.1 YcxB family protein [Acinetobacter sp. T_3_1]